MESTYCPSSMIHTVSVNVRNGTGENRNCDDENAGPRRRHAKTAPSPGGCIVSVARDIEHEKKHALLEGVASKTSGKMYSGTAKCIRRCVGTIKGPRLVLMN
jgi:hypothetical protein